MRTVMIITKLLIPQLLFVRAPVSELAHYARVNSKVY